MTESFSVLASLRLREEVEILNHLSKVSTLSGGRHPNVLAYIDSWEEDEALHIQTELCESGNLARFLWEYGRVFPKLDEGRVWKIVVDLANVSKLTLFSPSACNSSNSRVCDLFMMLESYTWI